MPIVEPEVLMDGTHTIERSLEVTDGACSTRSTTSSTSSACTCPGTLLKPNMVLSGYELPEQASDDEVAAATIDVLPVRVPAAVPGIVFLSGGQTDEQATARLNAMNKLGPLPWQLSFSYGRALQAPALKAWKGETANVEAGAGAYAAPGAVSTALARSGELHARDGEVGELARELRPRVRALVQRVSRGARWPSTMRSSARSAPGSACSWA